MFLSIDIPIPEQTTTTLADKSRLETGAFPKIPTLGLVNDYCKKLKELPPKRCSQKLFQP